MTQLYDIDIKYALHIFGYNIIIAKRTPDPDLGYTLGSIDIKEQGVIVSCVNGISDGALALAEVHADMIRKEAPTITGDKIACLTVLVDKYKEADVQFPLAQAYAEMVQGDAAIDSPYCERDKDVS